MTQSHLLCLLSVLDFCREYRVSRSFAYGLLQDGALTAVKVGRLTRIRRSDAEAWVAGLATFKRATPKRKPIQSTTWDRRPGARAKARAKIKTRTRELRAE
jgi:excisionase family DNA binding protein